MTPLNVSRLLRQSTYLLATCCLAIPLMAYADKPNFYVPEACKGKASGAGLENPSDVLPPQVTAYYVDLVTPDIVFLSIDSVSPIPDSKFWSAKINIPPVTKNKNGYKGSFILDVSYTPLLNVFVQKNASSPGVKAFTLPRAATLPKDAELLPVVDVTIYNEDHSATLAGAFVQFHSAALTAAIVGMDDTSPTLTEEADDNGIIKLQCMIFLEGANWVTVYDKDHQYRYDAPLELINPAGALSTTRVTKSGEE
ncbi:UNVERIFIED_ORG: hypothetical protein J2806_002722 [Kosakonia oryzae]|uniref:P pilus assembly protein, chaperone PapD n=2 Tax=Kosakonia radicincitans TaxID=283686 RepID=A0AAX2EP39_9ENTR|nr:MULTISPECIES: hypothetical protein [Kosakonia]MDP9567050.1 hypothetical protein [Kosakonia oryzae]SFE74177.1 hypothetical protein SAMN03159468_02621 [Kosakonia radicincitans]SFR03527.1 hypothetical protein SAMN03159514_01158 [Kosakonia radicincitans]SFT58115.1 hypothetical protein SAMN03159428_01186 [Kosakonia radicincitans]SFX31730.1 hypothetical protein SAMN03159436_01155 [Kosakonia radicincitans]